MKAVILNSGAGRRMGDFTLKSCKCMAEITPGVTIIDRQLSQLITAGITDILITTGPFAAELEEYVRSRFDAEFTFINNPEFQTTNYIYSIYLARRELAADGEILLLHGDLVFEAPVLADIIKAQGSYMVTDPSLPLPEKDFKAVIKNGEIVKVGIEFFDNAAAAQPLYKLTAASWGLWLDEIIKFCERGDRSVYAENALNALEGKAKIKPFNVTGRFCGEVDNPGDLEAVQKILENII